MVAKIARIPPKNVSKDDAEVLKDLEKSLKRVVFGQDDAIEALSLVLSNWHVLVCASLKSPSATTCSQALPVLGKTEVAKAAGRYVGR